MAQLVRKPPSPSDHEDPRAEEYFFKDLYDQGRMAGSLVFDLPSIIAGGVSSFTITVKGALPDKAQTVEYGLPSAWNDSLVVASVRVSAVDTVKFTILNPTGGSIDMASGTYSVRVRP